MGKMNQIKFRHLQFSECFLAERCRTCGRGTKLLERGRHGSHLTAAGEIFHNAVAPSLEQIRRAYSLGSEEHAAQETVTIGALPTLSAGFLPKVVHQLKANGFRATVRVVQGTNVKALYFTKLYFGWPL